MFVGVGVVFIGTGLRTRGLWPVLFGALFGGGPLLLGRMVTTTVAFLLLVGFAVIATILGYRWGNSAPWRDVFPSGRRPGGSRGGRRHRDSPGGTWATGSSDSSSSSVSSSSSDDFGGGSSGGGGVSGSW